MNDEKEIYMKKISCIAMLLLLIPIIVHAQSAKEAIMALKRLEARVQAGIKFRDMDQRWETQNFQ